MTEIQKKVLVTQLSEGQGKLWQAALTSQKLEVFWQPAGIDIVELFQQIQKEGRELPNLLIMDMGITNPNSTSLQAVSVCRWCAEHQPNLKVILTNPRQDKIKSVERKWANRQGAAGLLPRLYKDTILDAIAQTTAILNCRLIQEPLDRLAETLAEIADHEPVSRRDAGASVREAATAELVRKMALIPLIVMSDDPEIPQSEISNPDISLAETLQGLTLHDVQIEIDRPGSEVSQIFKDMPMLPGVILTSKGEYAGMISRTRFLEYMSRPFALELFSRRPIRVLYESAQYEMQILPGQMAVVNAAQACLQRSAELMYEPIVVKVDDRTYKLLDVHDLFIAQSQIHELATKLLREQTQARMVQTEKMASLGQMVAEISHDLRNPVQYIHGNIGYLSGYCNDLIRLLGAYDMETVIPSERVTAIKQEIDLDFLLQDLPKVIGSVNVGTDQLKTLVGGLQSFSHMSDNQAALFSVNENIENSLVILSNRLKDNIEVVKNFGDLPEVMGYSGQIIQVFMNILSNAVDALSEYAVVKTSESNDRETNGNGAVAVKIKPWKPQIEITTAVISPDMASPVDRWVSIRIADNGPGIPQDIQGRIFETFFTTKLANKGTGLGMAISYQIVTQKHGGKLTLRSPFNGTTGTEFEVLLPLDRS